jgi:hypothetical protein
MFCNKCGAALEGPGGFCDRCGTPVVVLPSIPPAQLVQPKLRGVEGWLLLFVVGQAIVGPALLIRAMSGLSATSPFTYLGFAEVSLGFVAAILLWLQRTEAITCLRVFFALGILIEGTKLLLVLGTLGWETVLWIYLYRLIWFFGWYSYFRTSVRVRNTYGRNI